MLKTALAAIIALSSIAHAHRDSENEEVEYKEVLAKCVATKRDSEIRKASVQEKGDGKGTVLVILTNKDGEVSITEHKFIFSSDKKRVVIYNNRQQIVGDFRLFAPNKDGVESSNGLFIYEDTPFTCESTH